MQLHYKLLHLFIIRFLFLLCTVILLYLIQFHIFLFYFVNDSYFLLYCGLTLFCLLYTDSTKQMCRKKERKRSKQINTKTDKAGSF